MHYPPVLDPERFSLWLCAVLLPPQALQQRLACLHQRSSAKRLRFAQQIMEGSLALTSSQRDETQAARKYTFSVLLIQTTAPQPH